MINDQLTSLKALEEKVNIALNKAEKAKNTAQGAHSKTIGWFGSGTKDAVYSLQNATIDLADAQYLSADTQKVILQYQAKLAEISKYLFALGVFNIAANRTIVRELELKLKNGSLSKGKVSELAQQEILNVIKQLKAQEDIMVKQEKMTDKIKQHQIILDYSKQVDSKHEKLIKQLISEDDEQDKILEKHEERNRELEIKIELLENEIKELKNNCENLENILKNKTDKKITYVLIGLIIVSLICSMIQFL